MFGVHAAFYTSQPIFAPLDEPGSRLLTPNQDPINVLGQVYGRVKLGDQEFRGGRLLVDTPLINPQDNRMVPNTFQGTIVTTLPELQALVRLLRRLSVGHQAAGFERLHFDVGRARGR